uniref:Uncharacterized protein n=1 Tax=Strigamia maritima TaxID=126957 RepID=T1J671_STRMM
MPSQVKTLGRVTMPNQVKSFEKVTLPNQVKSIRKVTLPNHIKMANYFATVKIFQKQTFDTGTQTELKGSPTSINFFNDSKNEFSVYPIYEDEALYQIEKDRIAKRIDQLCKKVPAVYSKIGVSWFKALEPEFSKPYFRRISFYLTKDKKAHAVYPKQELMYNWTTKCDIRNVKVVILGRQPAHLDNYSNGKNDIFLRF